MATAQRVWILSGRFQPFHWGHLAVARSACAAMPDDCTLILAVVAPLIGDKVTNNDFTLIAEEHHTAERNPWTLTTRLLALQEVAELLYREYPGTSVAVSAIPRPDLGWDTLLRWFPGDRTWIVPDAQEDFDEAKVSYFREKGENVIRFNGETSVDGRLLRARFAVDASSASLLLPDMVRDAYVAGWRNEIQT
jgi:hypothetical protein